MDQTKTQKRDSARLKYLLTTAAAMGLLCISSHVFAQSQPPPPPPPPNPLNLFKKHKKDTSSHKKADTAKNDKTNASVAPPPGPPGGPPPPPNPLNLFKKKKKKDTTKTGN